jgi:hypothetical protein
MNANREFWAGLTYAGFAAMNTYLAIDSVAFEAAFPAAGAVFLVVLAICDD